MAAVDPKRTVGEMLKTASILLTLSMSCLAQDATWMNLTDDGWCYLPKPDYTAPIKHGPSNRYCLSNSFKLRSVDTNYLHFVNEDDDLPTVYLNFHGGTTAAQRSVVQFVLPGLVFQREYWEGELRLLRFGPGESKLTSMGMHQVYIEFPTGSVATIWGQDLERVETALSHLIEQPASGLLE